MLVKFDDRRRVQPWLGFCEFARQKTPPGALEHQAYSARLDKAEMAKICQKIEKNLGSKFSAKNFKNLGKRIFPMDKDVPRARW